MLLTLSILVPFRLVGAYSHYFSQSYAYIYLIFITSFFSMAFMYFKSSLFFYIIFIPCKARSSSSYFSFKFFSIRHNFSVNSDINFFSLSI
jgi:hypothetical protein